MDLCRQGGSIDGSGRALQRAGEEDREAGLCLMLPALLGKDTRSILTAISIHGRCLLPCLLQGDVAGAPPWHSPLALRNVGALVEVAHLGRRWLGSSQLLLSCFQLMSAGAVSHAEQLFSSVQFSAGEEHPGEGRGCPCFLVL